MHFPSLGSLRPLGAGAAAVAALALTGCGPGILAQSYHQNDVIGTAQVDQTHCGNYDTRTDPTTPKCSTAATAFLGAQYLLAYQVRDDVTAPGTIATANDQAANTTTGTGTTTTTTGTGLPTDPNPVNQTVTYTASPSYSSELQRLYPAPVGQHWAGYISNMLTPEYNFSGICIISPAGCITPTGQHAPDQWDVSPQFALRQPTDGPFTGPFTYATVVGFRLFEPSGASGGTINGLPLATSDSDPVACYDPAPAAAAVSDLSAASTGDAASAARALSKELTKGLTGGGATASGNAFCDAGDDNDSGTAPAGRAPVPPTDGSARPAGYTFANHINATRDLWLGGSAGTAITQGTSGNVPFTARFAGLSGASFSMTATSDVAGATLAPQPGTFAPAGDSTTAVPVTVTVPSSTPIGQHTLTLTAHGVNGQQRTATATFDVAAAIVAPSRSAGRVVIKHQFLVRLVGGGRERVRLSCPANSTGCAGTLMFHSRFGNSNTTQYVLAAGQSKTYLLTPSKNLLRYLHRHKRSALGTATVIVTSGAGKSTRVIHISPRP